MADWPAHTSMRPAGAVLLVAALLGLRCAGSEAPPPPVEPGQTILLARQPEALFDLQLAGHNRPEGLLRAPNRFTVDTELIEASRDDKAVTWVTPMPVGGVWLSEHRGKRPNGMQLFYFGEELVYAKHNLGAKSWWTDGDKLFVRLGLDVAPDPKQLQVTFARAAAHSRMLNDATDPRNGKEFALRMQPMGDDHRHGLLLPAPSRATFRVDLPAGSAVRSRVHILPPGVRQGFASDGATLTVEVSVGKDVRTTELPLTPDEPAELDLDLGELSGTATVRFLTAPGETAVYDYVFLEEPAIEPAHRARGRKVVMVFLDTVRADHTSIGGSRRDTTPALRRFSEKAAVFTDARTVAAWTLPSARSAFTGRQPEHWGSAPTLMELLAADGFRSAFIATNGFTAAEYEMDRGFSEHILRFLEPADELTDRAIGLLEEHADEDYMLVVQYMDAHLPYREPDSHLTLWAAAEPPPQLGRNPRHITLNTLRAMPDDPKVYDEARDYLLERYDQNLRFIDDQLERLFAVLHEDDVVVVFADHGEEFLEHGYWEHGHSLFEEIVHVPMVVSGPGIAAGRVDSPTSLVDLAPTVLDSLGIDVAVPFDGQSLVAATHKQPEALEELAERPIAMGRTLYFGDEWGVVYGGKKWLTSEGTESLYDLAADPTEQSDLAKDHDLGAWPELLAAGLGGEVGEAWLLIGPGDDKMIVPGEVGVRVTHPKGLTAAWRPAHIFPVTDASVKDGVFALDVLAGRMTAREVYLLGQEGASPEGLELSVTARGETWKGTVAENAGNVLVEVGPPDLRYRLVRARAPLFRNGTLDAYSPLMSDALKELGYLKE
ncbi:MAG: hypothetical protein EP330_02265 [Deltaproteobacteria bacterium]|nr:MAG: hypothetical protein EP330_02265 [Deltaproteobacteria bacterium]